MRIGDEIECQHCSETITVDAFEIEDGEAFCTQCGEMTPIFDEEEPEAL